jgi:hypothetical protein
LIIFVEINNNYSSLNPSKLIETFNIYSLLLSFNPSKLIWALPSPISQFQNTGSVAYVLHFVPVFCPLKKADKRTGFSKKEKTILQPPNASKMARKTTIFIHTVPTK